MCVCVILLIFDRSRPSSATQCLSSEYRLRLTILTCKHSEIIHQLVNVSIAISRGKRDLSKLNVSHFITISFTSRYRQQMTSHCIVLSVFATMERLQLLLLLWLKRRRNRRYWVHPIFQLRETFGEYHHLMQQVLSDDEKCLAYIRMRTDTFKTLLEMIGPHIEKRTTNFRKPLPATERLVITLR